MNKSREAGPSLWSGGMMQRVALGTLLGVPRATWSNGARALRERDAGAREPTLASCAGRRAGTPRSKVFHVEQLWNNRLVRRALFSRDQWSERLPLKVRGVRGNRRIGANLLKPAKLTRVPLLGISTPPSIRSTWRIPRWTSIRESTNPSSSADAPVYPSAAKIVPLGTLEQGRRRTAVSEQV